VKKIIGSCVKSRYRSGISRSSYDLALVPKAYEATTASIHWNYFRGRLPRFGTAGAPDWLLSTQAMERLLAR
jgi:hypothetical protein